MTVNPNVELAGHTPQSEQELVELAEQVVRGQLEADVYFAAVERRAAEMIDRESGVRSFWRS